VISYASSVPYFCTNISHVWKPHNHINFEYVDKILMFMSSKSITELLSFKLIWRELAYIHQIYCFGQEFGRPFYLVCIVSTLQSWLNFWWPHMKVIENISVTWQCHLKSYVSYEDTIWINFYYVFKFSMIFLFLSIFPNLDL
jgi:hypothetical protein